MTGGLGFLITIIGAIGIYYLWVYWPRGEREPQAPAPDEGVPCG